MRNHQVTQKQRLLKEDGSLQEPGWSTSLLQQYDRSQIKAPKFRIKEWDYYLVLNQNFGVAFTLSDDGYFGLQSVSFLDFIKPSEHTETILTKFPMGKLGLPSTSEKGTSYYHDDRLHLEYRVGKEKRQIICLFKNFLSGKTLKCNLLLDQPPMDTMVIATPWKEKKTAFYYNQKINCLRASGHVQLGNRRYNFNPETDFATLDWGRGVWTYNNTWYWATGNGVIEDKPFGFNLGYGFGDTSASTENVLFYDGVAHKLDDVSFHIPLPSHTAPWTFSSSDGRFEMEFLPIIDRTANIHIGPVRSDQHQVFGHMNGIAILDDGTKLVLKDFLCSAEHIHNKF